MSDRMITFTGQVSIADAKRLIAEAEAQPVVEEGRLYVPECAKRVGLPLVRWVKRAGVWHHSTDGGATWTAYSKFTDAMLMSELVPYEPEPGVVYRHVETTEQEPYGNSSMSWHLYRLGTNGWEHKGHADYSEWSAWTPCEPDDVPLKDIHYGRRIPYLGYQETPRLTVGQWVQHKTQPWAKVKQVTSLGCYGSVSVRLDDAYDFTCDASQLRPATAAEITEAKRIEPKVGMLLRLKTNGDVYWLSGGGLDGWYGRRLCQPNVNQPATWMRRDWITTDHYDILPRYTVEGVS